ncbi:MAG: cytochrome c biogenesis CcdA family protein, partial [Candidatus Micrarchaeota archaeon]|nr:cytochrome c biogenesis CcdA family protein [Candidatus Micrarchaeota archaeon]
RGGNEMNRVGAFVLFCLLVVSAAYAECPNEARAYYIYSQGCIHCAAVEQHVIGLEKKYSECLKMDKLEILYNQDNQVLARKFCLAYGVNCSERIPTPMMFIGNTSLLGDKAIREQLEPAITGCIAEGCPDAKEIADVEIDFVNIEPTIPLIILAALVDSINPCAFAVLIFMLTYLSSIGGRSRMLRMGMVYIAAVYVAYFTAGMSLLTFVQSLSLSLLVYRVAAVLAIAGGIVNLKDYFFYGKWFSLEIPKSRSETIQEYIMKATLPAAVVLGILVAAVELPCTGGVYLAVIAMLGWAPLAKAASYLLLYNLFFVLPLVAILVVFYRGYGADELEEERLKKRKYMKLAIGVLMILLGAGMLLGWFGV